MKAMSRRLRKLEDRFGLAPETEFSKQLRERLERARRRLAEAGEHGECAGSDSDNERESLAGLSVGEILHRARERAAQRQSG